MVDADPEALPGPQAYNFTVTSLDRPEAQRHLRSTPPLQAVGLRETIANWRRSEATQPLADGSRLGA